LIFNDAEGLTQSLKFEVHTTPPFTKCYALDILAPASRASTNKQTTKKFTPQKKAVFTGLVTQGILAGHACKATCYPLSG